MNPTLMGLIQKYLPLLSRLEMGSDAATEVASMLYDETLRWVPSSGDLDALQGLSSQWRAIMITSLVTALAARADEAGNIEIAHP